jgi:hypothetical protein
VDGESVDAMAEAVAAAYPRLSHRYYALKARAMGKAKLDQWDRNAPIETSAPRGYDWAAGKQLVLESFADLGPEFADRAGGFFDRPCLDGKARPGKQSGAYAHPVTSDRHPYVFLNWMGERRDVLTLAHELGHGVHQTLAAGQGSLLADTPLTLAETASIFAEGLTFDRLLSTAPKAEQRGLLAGRIEDGLNTVVRQIAFHRFETRFHDERAKGELAVERIGELFLEARLKEDELFLEAVPAELDGIQDGGLAEVHKGLNTDTLGLLAGYEFQVFPGGAPFFRLLDAREHGQNSGIDFRPMASAGSERNRGERPDFRIDGDGVAHITEHHPDTPHFVHGWKARGSEGRAFPLRQAVVEGISLYGTGRVEGRPPCVRKDFHDGIAPCAPQKVQEVEGRRTSRGQIEACVSGAERLDFF